MTAPRASSSEKPAESDVATSGVVASTRDQRQAPLAASSESSHRSVRVLLRDASAWLVARAQSPLPPSGTLPRKRADKSG